MNIIPYEPGMQPECGKCSELVRINECHENMVQDLLEKNINMAQYGNLIAGLMLFEYGVISLQKFSERF